MINKDHLFIAFEKYPSIINSPENVYQTRDPRVTKLSVEKHDVIGRTGVTWQNKSRSNG